jgi:hypothetical protein
MDNEIQGKWCRLYVQRVLYGMENEPTENAVCGQPWVTFAMQNRRFGPCLVAINVILMDSHG